MQSENPRRHDGDGVSAKRAKPAVVFVIGEEGGRNLTLLEPLLEWLSRSASTLVFLIGKKRRFFGRKTPEVSEGYSQLVSSARELGLEAFVRVVCSRDVVEGMAGECLKLSSARPDAVFCFISWGLDSRADLKGRLERTGLKTAMLGDVVESSVRCDEKGQGE